MRSVCCYAIDPNYILPALVSAIQARAFISSPDVDVVICCIGGDRALEEIVTPICEANRIEVKFVSQDVLEGQPSVCARFFLHKIIGDQYGVLLYLDADTQVQASLDDLLQHKLSPGFIAAACDPMCFLMDNTDAHWVAQKRYFLSLGIPVDKPYRYLNGGVLMAGVDDWAAISAECSRNYANGGAALKFKDQDILNQLMKENWTPISLKWNFPTFFGNCGIGNVVAPVISHFMSKPRPWDGAFQPWGTEGHSPYIRLTDRYPQLRPMLKPFRGKAYARYTLQQAYKRLVETRTWNTRGVRALIAGYEQQVAV